MKELYKQIFHQEPAMIERLAGAGSNREYFRLYNDKGNTVVGVKGMIQEENHAFLYISKFLASHGINVPQIYGASEDEMTYLQQDLDNTQLFDLLLADHTKALPLVEKSIRHLAHLQVASNHSFDWQICYPVKAFNERSIMWDLNYFKYCFLKIQGIEILEDKLENEFCLLTSELLKTDCSYFMYRDFQSRNVMIHNNEPYFIDFQGGRRGPLQYDIVSFLWQARAGFTDEEREQMISAYLDELSNIKTINEQEFKDSLPYFVLLRTLQVLGAYGYRGLIEKKEHFIKSIPAAIQNLRQVLATLDFPYLSSLVEHIHISEVHTLQTKPSLIVTVGSFSYKKGYPTDDSGNGGGFVFDCRAMHNPGRYEQYKQLTGKDREVIDFLEQQGEVQPFLQNAYNLVDKSVERYLQRGFTNLSVWFGCTGGQHRSVYCAEKMAKHIIEKYHITVRLIHREREQ